MNLPPLAKPLERFHYVVLILVLGMGISTAFHYFKSSYMKANYPQDTFLFHPEDRFNDYKIILSSAALENPYTNEKLVYFPAMIAVLKVLNLLPAQGMYFFLPAFLLSSLAIAYFFLFFFFFLLRCLGVFLFGFWNYFVVFTADRLNFEILVFWGLAAFFISEKIKKPKWGIWGLALATSIKAFPGFFSIYYLVQKRYREFVYFGLASALLTLLGFLCAHSSFSETFLRFVDCLQIFQTGYAYTARGCIFSLSLPHVFYIIGDLFRIVHLSFVGECFIYLAKWFFITLPLWLFAAVSIFKSSRLDLHHKFLFGVALFLLLPPVSYDYKGIHLILPFLMLLGDFNPKNFDLNFRLAILLSFLFIPKNYFSTHENIGIGSLINPILLVVICSMLWQNAFEKKKSRS